MTVKLRPILSTAPAPSPSMRAPQPPPLLAPPVPLALPMAGRSSDFVAPVITAPPTNVDEAQLRLALAARLTRAGGTGTAEDVAAVVGELSKMPLKALLQMQKNGTKVVACRGSVTDYLASYRGLAPRGWPPGSTWDQVPGFFEPSRNEVVIGTEASSAADETRRVPPFGHGHGSSNMVLHESGHSLDYRGNTISAHDANFKAAYAADLANLPPYLAQTGGAGPEEAFAESLALSVTQVSPAEHYPHLMQYWADHSPFT